MLDSPAIDIEEQKLVLEIYANISCNYHKIDQHNLAIKFAAEGIEYTKKCSNMYHLYLLYARKGVSQLLLGYDEYIDILHKNILLLETTHQVKLTKLHREIVYNQYHITL
jgi:hypothetical protein